ncbi:MAG: response regulator [Acetobacteraceae bacterium]
MSEALRVLLVEDHPIVRAGCQRLLEAWGETRVIGARSVAEGLERLAEQAVDLVIFDLGLPDGGGINGLRHLLSVMPALKILVFSMHEEPVIVASALEAGARGYVSKNDDPSVLLEAAARINAGDIYLSRSIAQKLALMNILPGAGPLRGLSAREHDVLALLGKGQSLAEVAAALGVSYRTAAAITAQMRTKLNLPSMAALIRLAVEHGSAAGQTPPDFG